MLPNTGAEGAQQTDNGMMDGWTPSENITSNTRQAPSVSPRSA